MSEIPDGELKRLARGFRSGVLDRHVSEMMCAVVCYPLQGYLSMLGVETKIEEVDLRYSNHVFLRLPDGRILDPAADQFGGPEVYLGSEERYYIDDPNHL